MDTNYKVLYRKYRPTNFNEVVGQKYTINMLKNAIINNKLSHAYIFTGPRGTGKTSTAKIFAKTINCEALEDAIPCGKCHSCENIENNADIIEIDAASNNGVDEIRELINNVKIAPSFSKYKVYIIDEVHMLSQSAFNALLLTLEEPPSHIIFILATTNIENVPITILSRCQRFDFKKIDNEDITNHLKSVSNKENIDITDEAIKEISYLADGGLRDALSILNQLSTSSSSVTLETILANYGSVSIVKIKSIIESFLKNDYNELKKIFDDLMKSSIDYKNFIKKMIDELFIIAINYKSENDGQKYSLLKKVVFELNDLINKININVDPFLLIFMIFVENMGSIDIFKIPEKLEDDKVEIQDKGTEIVINDTKNLINDSNFSDFIVTLIPIRINNCFAQADKNNLKIFKENWHKFIENNDLNNELKNLVIDCDVVLASSNVNIVIHPQKSIVELFNKELLNIERKYKECVGVELKLLALTTTDWNKEKEIYISKIRDGYKYSLLNEPVLEEIAEKIENQDETNVLNNILEIFDESKLIIQ